MLQLCVSFAYGLISLGTHTTWLGLGKDQIFFKHISLYLVIQKLFILKQHYRKHCVFTSSNETQLPKQLKANTMKR